MFGAVGEFVVFPDRGNVWRWRMVVGRDILAISTNQYRTEQECRDSIAVPRTCQGWPVRRGTVGPMYAPYLHRNPYS